VFFASRTSGPVPGFSTSLYVSSKTFMKWSANSGVSHTHTLNCSGKRKPGWSGASCGRAG
jgi:hypothetical protein